MQKHRKPNTIRTKPFARQLRRVRKICLALPGANEKLSHGEPTFFIKERRLRDVLE